MPARTASGTTAEDSSARCDDVPLNTHRPVDKRPYMPNISDPDRDHHYTYLHGDPVELLFGRLVYFCRICDTFEDAEHFRSHNRQKNIGYYQNSQRILANLSCGKWISRPDSAAADDNLIGRALDREWERKNAPWLKQVREALARQDQQDRAQSDAGVQHPFDGKSIRGR